MKPQAHVTPDLGSSKGQLGTHLSSTLGGCKRFSRDSSIPQILSLVNLRQASHADATPSQGTPLT